MAVITDPTHLRTEALWSQRELDPSARGELVRRHLGLARGLALRYRNGNEPSEDLVQVASLALVKAVDRFDPERGIPFAGFASPTILGELRRHFRDTGWSVHVPRGAKERALEVTKAAAALAESLGRSPTVVELAAQRGTTVEETVEALEAAQAHYAHSTDAPVAAGDADREEAPSMLDLAGREDEGYALVELAGSLGPALRRLPRLEREALELRMRGNLTQWEVAQLLGCSQMQVSRLLRRAARRVREELAVEVA
jgi:RNA polymerase sigma-B factor